MPPVVRYSKGKIIEVGLKIVEEHGFEYISARTLAKELGCSICPVFSCFSNMEDLKIELLKAIFNIYSKFIEQGMKDNEKAFKGAGLAYVKFARNYKNYFKSLFMNKNESKLEDLLKIDFNNEKILDVIQSNSGLDKDSALKLYKYNWVFVHGIAVMVATDYCVLSDDEISEMLTVEYLSLLNRFKENVMYEKNN